MAEDSDTVLFERRGVAGWIVFSRPERMNALSPQMVRAMWAQLAKVEADPEVRVLVLTGQGDAFCAGMDMAGLEQANAMAARRRSREIQMLTGRIAELSLPTIAAVGGVAMGAGLEICLACDLAVASEGARFAFPEARLGMIPCGGGTQRLARVVGLRRARDMIFSGRILDAALAVEWGLVNEAVSDMELADTVQEMAEKIAAGGRIALYQAKRCINHALDMDLGRGLEYETECFTTCFASGEPAAALRRFTTPGPQEEVTVAEADGPAEAPQPGDESPRAEAEEEGPETLAVEEVAPPAQPPDDDYDEDIFE
ncbi:MAG: enoyl-CoA hydratase/isomerase family protein [Actinomycetota bacterium]